MKKKLAMLLTAAMLVGSLAACGSSDNGSSATGSASATDSTKTDAAATEVSTEGKQLTVQIGSDPETIDPALNSAVDGLGIGTRRCPTPSIPLTNISIC